MHLLSNFLSKLILKIVLTVGQLCPWPMLYRICGYLDSKVRYVTLSLLFLYLFKRVSGLGWVDSPVTLNLLGEQNSFVYLTP